MKKINSVSSLCEKIFQLESEKKLLELKVNDVYIWQSCRMQLYYKLAVSLGILEEPHVNNVSMLSRLKYFFSHLVSVTWFNPFFRLARADVVIFPHPRKKFVSGKYLDIYTDDIERRLIKNNNRVLVIEKRNIYKHVGHHRAYVRHSDFIDIISGVYSNIMRRYSRLSLNYNEILKEAFGVDLDVDHDLKKQFYAHQCKRFLYSLYFSFVKPSEIYLVVGYSQAPLIDAAKRKSIKVTEIQHGVITKYHLGYSFPFSKPENIKYFPNVLCTWGEYWKKACSFPVSDEYLVTSPPEHIVAPIKRYKNTIKNNRKMVVISQGSIGRKLSEKILEYVDVLQGCEIIYKLHPSEYERWAEYPALMKLVKYENFTVVDNNSSDVLKIMADAQFVIGVYSTAIFEALDLGCSILLCDLPGVEYMDELINSGNAELIKSMNDIQRCINY